jgi:hypothetical protein
MNKELTISQLAKSLNVNPGVIGVAIKRDKLKKNDSGVINIDDPLNKFWLSNQIAKGKTFDINRIYQQTTIVKKQNIELKHQLKQDDVNTRESYPTTEQGKAGLSERKMLVDLERAEEQLKLDKLKVRKMEGHLIPVDAVQHMNIFIIETIRSRFNQEIESLANIYVGILGATHEQFTEIRKKNAEIVQGIMSQAQDDLKNGTAGAVNEYKEVRGRGESK